MTASPLRTCSAHLLQSAAAAAARSRLEQRPPAAGVQAAAAARQPAGAEAAARGACCAPRGVGIGCVGVQGSGIQAARRGRRQAGCSAGAPPGQAAAPPAPPARPRSHAQPHPAHLPPLGPPRRQGPRCTRPRGAAARRRAALAPPRRAAARRTPSACCPWPPAGAESRPRRSRGSGGLRRGLWGRAGPDQGAQWSGGARGRPDNWHVWSLRPSAAINHFPRSTVAAPTHQTTPPLPPSPARALIGGAPAAPGSAMGPPGAVALASAEALRLEGSGHVDCTTALPVRAPRAARGARRARALHGRRRSRRGGGRGGGAGRCGRGGGRQKGARTLPHAALRCARPATPRATAAPRARRPT
jgi:hypothetical protein